MTAAKATAEPSESPVDRIELDEPHGTFEIDGKLYELRNLSDYGIAAQQRLSRDGREYFQLWQSDNELDDDQQKRLKFVLDRMFLGDDRALPLLDAPKTLLRKLDDASRARVVMAFTFAPLRKTVAQAAQITETDATAVQGD